MTKIEQSRASGGRQEKGGLEMDFAYENNLGEGEGNAYAQE
jgi:hypothetical protein